ncbi:elongation factor Tu GTP binding domain-containing protein [Cardiosporidium cionae]|uniref:Elongation factor Tu GTP binding domain-containing protein n=1 Tax=Cardiosporidium cionae TaxID=476202 RepID=A0ABQ7J9T7_9APIC|nr:elongation factor Tu GTP binding domain-containing protein [Cardiosporidium cionae]|eukprot:KAF8820713.1 elongation factor Tu GTP binding domain-containing protein [Cardiosporidium cionae]
MEKWVSSFRYPLSSGSRLICRSASICAQTLQCRRTAWKSCTTNGWIRKDVPSSFTHTRFLEETQGSSQAMIIARSLQRRLQLPSRSSKEFRPFSVSPIHATSRKSSSSNLPLFLSQQNSFNSTDCVHWNYSVQTNSSFHFLSKRHCMTGAVASGSSKAIFRNVAIIAHVDHGKTTLVDALLRRGGIELSHSRQLDSNDLEKERGITILSKVTRLEWNGYVLNIVDTPGHADFGGEVERVLSMVDGVCLVVDAVEGPRMQTKFVLQKALLNPKCKPIVVINKVDRPNIRRQGECENEIFDLFLSVGATDEQMEYPTIYTSGKNGWCVENWEDIKREEQPQGITPLLKTIVDYVSPPEEEGVKNTSPFGMLTTLLDHQEQVGIVATGKIFSGSITKGQPIYIIEQNGKKNIFLCIFYYVFYFIFIPIVYLFIFLLSYSSLFCFLPLLSFFSISFAFSYFSLSHLSLSYPISLFLSSHLSLFLLQSSLLSPSPLFSSLPPPPPLLPSLLQLSYLVCFFIFLQLRGQSTVKNLYITKGTTRYPIEKVNAGDIVSMTFLRGITPIVTDTLSTIEEFPPLLSRPIDPPVICVMLSPNTSPLVGQDGQHVRRIGREFKHLTLASIGKRLKKEALSNVAIEVIESEQKDNFEVRGRGELQLGILLETLRREGFEVCRGVWGRVYLLFDFKIENNINLLSMSVSPPSVITKKDEKGKILEPWEEFILEVPHEVAPAIMEKLAARQADILDMKTFSETIRLTFHSSSKNFLGMRTFLKDCTKGTMTLMSEFLEYRPNAPPIKVDRNAIIISSTAGVTAGFSLEAINSKGNLFVPEGIPTYEGMILGEHTGAKDLEMNAVKTKPLVNVRSKGHDEAVRLNVRTMNIENCLTYILQDEQIEVTPKRVSMRKKILNSDERKAANRKAAQGK